MAAARLSAAFVYQSTDPRYSRVTGTGSGLALASGELPSSDCRVGRQPSQFQRSAFSSHLSFSGRIAKLKLTSHLTGSFRGGHFESPANASHLSSSFSGRHSPATSASEGPRHWHSPAISGRHRSRLSFRGQVRSGLFGNASHPRFRPASPATGRCLTFRATSQQQLPPLSRRRRSAARLRLRCPEARRHQASGRETGAT